jgi:hypothetical protein
LASGDLADFPIEGTVEVIGTELQAVLSTLAEQDLQTCRSAGNNAYEQMGPASTVMVASRPRIGF